MKRSVLFYLLGVLVFFIVVLAPMLTLLAWLVSGSVSTYLLIALLLSVPAFYSFWFILNKSHNMQLRWLGMQLLGVGALLLPLVVIASPFTAVVENKTVGLIVLVLWPVVGVFGLWQALSIKPTHLQFDAPQLDKSLRLVHLSDVHVGSRSAAFLQRVVDITLSHKPDVVLITGDLLDSSTVDTDQLRPLQQIGCPTFMCIGNHERYVNLDKAISAIEANDVRVLRDESTEFGQLQLVGIDDRDRPDSLPDILARNPISSGHYSVLLYHRPDGWSAALQHAVDLTLAGHTHAGQIWPFGMLVKRQYPTMAGHFSKGKHQLYVSAGTGTWGPIFRLGTRSELTVIDLGSPS